MANGLGRAARRSLIALAVLAFVYAGVQAGGLEPPSPRTSVDPRIPIHESDLPLTITTPGSYYLAESITTLGPGIVVSADNVTIDLKGFTLRGGTGDGISVVGTCWKNVTVENGTVTGWSGDGVDVNMAHNSIVRHVRAEANISNGIYVGEGSTVFECSSNHNGGVGIQNTNGGGTVIGSMASENTGDGIGGTWAMISGCTADRNGGTGISAACQRTPRETRLHANGPSFFGGAVITSCHATGNGEDGIAACSRSLVTNSNALGNGTRGIFNGINVGRGSMVSGCISNGNSGDGIQVVFESAIVGNTTNENGVAGIHAIGAGIRVEGNQLIRNVRGIVVEAAGNTIFKNTARDNAVLNYDIVGGNDVGPIGCAASCVSPWANLEF